MSVHTRVILHLPRFFSPKKVSDVKIYRTIFVSCDIFSVNHDRLVCEGRTIALCFAPFCFAKFSEI